MVNEKFKVTYCLNYAHAAQWLAIPWEDPQTSIVIKHKNRQFSSSNTECSLLVSTADLPVDMETLNQIMLLGNKLLEVFPVAQLWFVQLNKSVVIGTFPGALPHPMLMENVPGGVGCVDKNLGMKAWSYQKIYQQCQSWERTLSGCRSCPFCEMPLKCFSLQIEPEGWGNKTKEVNWDQGLFETMALATTVCVNYKQNSLSYSGFEVASFTEKVIRIHNLPFEFYSPRYTTDNPFEQNMRDANEHDFTHVIEAKKAASERAKNAAKTKASKVICRKECMFAERCIGSDPWHKHPTYCQENYECAGPFLLSELFDMQKEVVEGLSPEQRKNIEIICLNGGVATYLPFGSRLVLGKLDSDYQGVWWYSPKDVYRMLHYSIADSIKLLNTPFTHSARHSVMPYQQSTVSGEYTYPFKQNHRRLSDEILLCYLELCQPHTRIYRGNTWFGGCYLRPYGIKISGAVEEIRVQRFKSSIRNYLDLASAHQGIPLLFKDYLLRKRRERREQHLACSIS